MRPLHSMVVAVLIGAVLLAGRTLRADGPPKAPPADKPPYQRLLQGDDARKDQELLEKMNAQRQAGKFEEALKSAEELAALRKDRQGKDHYAAITAHFDADELRRVVASKKEDQEAYATSWRLRGQVEALEEKARFKEALPLREQILAIDRKVLGENHPTTAVSYHDLAAVLHALGRYREAEEGYKKAREVCLQMLGEEHPDTATAFHDFSVNLNRLGRYKEAQEGLDRTLAICRRAYGEEHADTAAAYSTVAYNLGYLGRYTEAEAGCRKALEIRRKVLGEDNAATGRSYNNLATNLHSQGRYKEAEENFRKALDIWRRTLGEEHPETARSYNNVAVILASQGRYAEADEGYRKALTIRRKVYGEEHPETAQSYHNVGGSLDDQGRYLEAEQGYRKALDIYRKVLGEEHPFTALSYNSVAVSLNNQERYKEAEEPYRKALQIRRKVLGEEHPETADSYRYAALNLHDQKRYQEAEEGLQKALEIDRKALGERHPHTADCYNDLAANRNAQGQRKEAEEGYRKALDVQRQALGEQHFKTAISYNNLAANLHAQGRYEEAERLYVRGAEAFAASRLQIAASGLGRATRSGERSPLPELAALLARNGKPAAAWQRLEDSLGRGTWDDLSARLRRPARELARQTELVKQLERIDQLLARQSAVDKPTPEQERERDELLDRRRAAYEDLARFTRHLEETYGPAQGQVFDRATIQAALPSDAAIVAWIDIPAVPRAADPNGEHWAVVLRSRGEPVFERLRGSGPGGTWTDDDDSLPEHLQTALQSPRGDWRDLARRLREQRLTPLARHLAARDKLPAVRQWIVLPSTALRGVPLEALGEEGTVSYASSGTLYAHLKKQPAVGSVGLLAVGDPVFEATPVAAKARPVPPGGVLITTVLPGSVAALAKLKPGDVLLTYAGAELKSPADLKTAEAPADAKDDVPIKVWREGTLLEQRVRPGKLGVVLAEKAAPEALAEQLRLDRLLAQRSGDGKWAPLPGTRVEVESLARLFGGKPLLLLDSDASEQRLDELATRGDLGRYRYLHLATHGEVDDARPLQSALILARDTLPDAGKQLLAGKPVYDGRLTAAEILRTWNLQSELVTLSACQTALGKYEKGEGHVGFAQALILAGSRAVCLSLWKVDDAATALFMDRFYQNLLGKREGLKGPLPKALALAEAKEWLRTLSREEALKRAALLTKGVERGKGRPVQPLLPEVPASTDKGDRPYAHPYYWAAFVLIGDPD